MSCTNALSLVPSYLDGELSEEQAAPLRAHLLECPGCREAVKRDNAMKRWFQEADDDRVEVPEGFAARVARRAFAGDPGVLVPRPQPVPSAGVLLPFVLKLSALAAGLLFLFSIGIRMTSLPSGSGLEARDPQPWERQEFPDDWVDDGTQVGPGDGLLDEDGGDE